MSLCDQVQIYEMYLECKRCGETTLNFEDWLYDVMARVEAVDVSCS